MRFGSVPLAKAEGAVLAHGYTLETARLRKGRVVDREAVEALRGAGVDEVVVARLDPDDVPEDDAAEALARAAAGPGLRVRTPFTGRCNLVAETDGVVRVDQAAVRAANAVDEALTLSTLPPDAPTRTGRLVATAKVIPLAVPESLLEQAVSTLRDAEAVVRIAPFTPHAAGMVLTVLPGTSERVLAKAEATLRSRLEASGSTLEEVRRCPHEPAAVAEALEMLRDRGLSPLFVLGASAVVDRADVVPVAVEMAGGCVERLGIPVDPGNLLLLARLDEVPVVGVPGCARSPKRSGFDGVLERILAGEPHTPTELAAMGVGGLLAEIPSRPQPREGPPVVGGGSARPQRVAGLVLAAGRSERMGRTDKLLARVDGETLVARAVDTAVEAALDPVVVVTGHGREDIRAALAGRDVRFADNPEPERGLSSSLAVGLAALDEERGDEAGEEAAAGTGAVDAVVVLLGDMPRVEASTVRTLVEAFESGREPSICVPVHVGKRGNPVLWAARHLPELGGLEGDVGGRTLLRRHADEVREVEVDDPGVLLDVDTPEALEVAGGSFTEGGPDGHQASEEGRAPEGDPTCPS